jgi:hypothetical protein
LDDQENAKGPGAGLENSRPMKFPRGGASVLLPNAVGVLEPEKILLKTRFHLADPYSTRAINLSSADYREPIACPAAAADSDVPTNATASGRLRPPADLGNGPEKRETFIALILASRADHFRESDLPLLSAYCRAIVREQTAAGELAAGGFVTSEGKSSPWAQVLKDAVRDMTVLSRLLRLNPVAPKIRMC